MNGHWNYRGIDERDRVVMRFNWAYTGDGANPFIMRMMQRLTDSACECAVRCLALRIDTKMKMVRFLGLPGVEYYRTLMDLYQRQTEVYIYRVRDWGKKLG